MGRKKKQFSGSVSSIGNFFHIDLSDGAKRGVIGVLLLGLALVILLSFLDIAGNMGAYVNLVIRRLFGWGGFFFPLALIILSISYFKSGETRVYRATFLGLFLFLLGFLALLFFGVEPASMIAVAHEGKGGGYMGMILGWPFMRLFGTWAAAVLETMFVVIGFIVTANISWDEFRERVDEWRSRRREKDGERDPEDGDRERQDIERHDENGVPSVQERPPRFSVKKVIPFAAKKQSPHPTTVSEMKIQSYKPDSTWKLPESDLLEGDDTEPESGDIDANAETIKKTFEQFGIDVEMGEVSVGPTVTQYTMKPAEGVKLTRITSLTDDLALSLAAHPIRIEAPIPGKSLVGVEVPNREVALVHLRNVIADKVFQKSKNNLVVGLGRDVAGMCITTNLEKMPHLLVAGATGSGKSVCINTLIVSLLYRNSPRQLKYIMIDPKRVELTTYNGIPHLLTPVITDPSKAVNALHWAIGEMDRRYKVLEESGSRNVFSYNEKTEDPDEKLPFIVIIVDELADLMAIKGKEVEAAIVRLAQMARAVGIHLVISTQRPSVDVLTGLIKANIPTRIAFQVPTQVDSRTILDGAGAEKLLGNGDMLYLSESKKPMRLQGAFVSEKDVRRLVNFWVDQVKERSEEEQPHEGAQRSEITEPQRTTTPGFEDSGDGVDDALYEEAKRLVIEGKKASASYLQRRLRIGYSRAARLLDVLEENGVIGPGQGSKPRAVLLSHGTEETAYEDPHDDDQRRAKWQM